MLVRVLAIAQDVKQASSRLFSLLLVLNVSKVAWSVVMILISVKNVVITISLILLPRNVLYVLRTVLSVAVRLFVPCAKVAI